jgi:hypothetical protein
MGKFKFTWRILSLVIDFSISYRLSFFFTVFSRKYSEEKQKSGARKTEITNLNRKGYLFKM